MVIYSQMMSLSIYSIYIFDWDPAMNSEYPKPCDIQS